MYYEFNEEKKIKITLSWLSYGIVYYYFSN